MQVKKGGFLISSQTTSDATKNHGLWIKTSAGILTSGRLKHRFVSAERVLPEELRRLLFMDGIPTLFSHGVSVLHRCQSARLHKIIEDKFCWTI